MQRRPQPQNMPISEPVAALLSVLRSAAIVLDNEGGVVRASAPAFTFGLLDGGQRLIEPVAALVRRVRDSGDTEDAIISVPRGPIGYGLLVLDLRVAPLGRSHILVLADDRTEVERTDEIRRDFVANISHELKTPIGALSLLAETVQDAADDPDAVRRFAGRLQTESARLGSLVGEIIDLSRLQAASVDLAHDRVTLGDVVAQAVEHSRTAAEAAGIELIAQSPPDVVVIGDKALLVTAVRNLLTNAINYSSAGEPVRLDVRWHGAVAEISVADHGLGIQPADQERIFERFYRVDQARSRSTGGTGLGLAIVKHIAADHGGDVRVWSRVGLGSTFTLRLPVARRQI